MAVWSRNLMVYYGNKGQSIVLDEGSEGKVIELPYATPIKVQFGLYNTDDRDYDYALLDWGIQIKENGTWKTIYDDWAKFVNGYEQDKRYVKLKRYQTEWTYRYVITDYVNKYGTILVYTIAIVWYDNTWHSRGETEVVLKRKLTE